MRTKGEKLIVLVFRALKEGCDTSNEIAEMIGHPVASVSATLSDMKKSKLVRDTKRTKCHHPKTGKRSKCWELVVE